MVLFPPGNFECGNPGNLESKCISVGEARDYIEVSRMEYISTVLFLSLCHVLFLNGSPSVFSLQHFFLLLLILAFVLLFLCKA